MSCNRILNCRTLFYSKSVVVALYIQSVDRKHSYVVYKILNFPLPLPTSSDSGDGSKLSARFKLESELITVNRVGTRYFLFSHAETVRCSASTSKSCRILNFQLQSEWTGDLEGVLVV